MITNAGCKFMTIFIGKFLDQNEVPFCKAAVCFNSSKHVLIVWLLLGAVIDNYFVLTSCGTEIAARPNKGILYREVLANHFVDAGLCLCGHTYSCWAYVYTFELCLP